MWGHSCVCGGSPRTCVRWRPCIDGSGRAGCCSRSRCRGGGSPGALGGGRGGRGGGGGPPPFALGRGGGTFLPRRRRRGWGGALGGGGGRLVVGWGGGGAVFPAGGGGGVVARPGPALGVAGGTTPFLPPTGVPARLAEGDPGRVVIPVPAGGAVLDGLT